MTAIFNTIPECLEELKKGRAIIVVDDEDRENEGDLIFAAEFSTPELINFVCTHARGLICAPMSKEKAQQLQLAPMVSGNNSRYHTAFTVSVDLIKGNTTGISCEDRANTLVALSNQEASPHEFMRPGHIFPLISAPGGVFQRQGHTEAAVDLCKLAGLKPVSAICEILNEDGTMSRRDDLMKMAQKFDLKIMTIKDLIKYRKGLETSLSFVEQINFPTKFGEFKLRLYEERVYPQGTEEMSEIILKHVAIIKGDVKGKKDVLLRPHSQCLTGDIFGSLRCDCGEQLEMALKRIEEAGEGVVIYLEQEGRGIGLTNKIKAYKFQESGHDTISANHELGLPTDLREYHMIKDILTELEVNSVTLLTNNPEKKLKLMELDICISNMESLEGNVNPANLTYLKTKKDKMGHLLNLS